MSTYEKKLGKDSKKRNQLSTLELWQAHIRTLAQADMQTTTHSEDTFDSQEHSHSIIVLSIPPSSA